MGSRNTQRHRPYTCRRCFIRLSSVKWDFLCIFILSVPEQKNYGPIRPDIYKTQKFFVFRLGITKAFLYKNLNAIKLWTMYCEQIHFTYDNEKDSSALNAIMEFWTKVTPGILQLLSQTKVVSWLISRRIVCASLIMLACAFFFTLFIFLINSQFIIFPK